MNYLVLVLCVVGAMEATAQEVEVAELSAPSCLRILNATATEATLQFEPHGGEKFEAEKYVSGKWKPFNSPVRTSGKTYSLIVPLTKNNMNNIRICAEADGKRICSTEGVYAKR